MKKVSLIAALLSFSLPFSTATAQERVHDDRIWLTPRTDYQTRNMGEFSSPVVHDVPVSSERRVLKSLFGTLTITPNIRVHPNNSTTQSEMSIAVHPSNPDILLAGSNAVDFSLGVGSQGWYYSTNSGNTWGGSDTLPTHTNLFEQLSDPAVAIDIDGRLFFNALTISTNVFVSRSTNGGLNWSKAVIPASGSGSDKNHLAVDVNPSSPFANSVYTAYTDFSLLIPPIVFSRSTDAGQTFSNPTSISGSTASQFAQGVNLAVGPNGELYAAWSGYNSWPPPVTTQLGFNKSTNGGASWGTASTIRPVNDLRGSLSKGGNSIRVSSFPSMAVDRGTGPRHGWIYIVYAEKNSIQPDVFLIRSTDGGSTWTSPHRVNSDSSGNDQWFPWIAVDPTTGLLAVTYYDSRNFASNDSAQVYVSLSLDGGNSFEDFLVSDQAFLPAPISGLASGYMGDYIGVAALNGKAWCCWNDNRTGIHQAYASTMTFINVGSPRRITVSPDSLNFGGVFVGYHDTLQLSVRNVGYPDTLVVSNITSDNLHFAPLLSSFVLPGGQGRTVQITFSPTLPTGMQTGLLTIASNDTARPIVTIPLRGLSTQPPNITVVPETLGFTVNEGDSTSGTTTIGNTGLGDLVFQIESDFLSLGASKPNASNGQKPNGVVPNRGINMSWIMPTDRELSESRVLQKIPASSLLPLIVGDSVGDGSPVDIKEIRGRAAGGNLELQLVFATMINRFDFGGYLGFDTDQNRLTGIPLPVGLSGQDVGCEYFISFFGLPTVNIYNSSSVLIGGVSASVDSFSFTCVIPLSLLGNDDGRINLASVVGNSSGPTDWIPDVGHGTVGSNWLSFAPNSGVVVPAGTAPITVHARSAGLLGGTYFAALHVHSNDPVRPLVDSYVRLRVIGAPNIGLSADTVEFGDGFIGHADTLALGVSNTGSDTLLVSGMSSNNPRFAIAGNSVIAVPPLETRNVQLVFLPIAVGVQNGTLAISSNDPSDPTVHVFMRGNGIHPPIIGVSPDSLAFTVNEGDSAQLPLTISNTGLGQLNWNITNTLSSAHVTLRSRSAFEMLSLQPTTRNSPLSVKEEQPTISPYSLTQFGRLDGSRHILAWVPYTDLTTGGEYENVVNAILQFFTDFTLDTSMTTNPTAFASQLSGKDILIIPEQEGIFDLSAVGTAFSSTVSSFLSTGKTMVVMDYLTTGSTTFLNGTGLMDITPLSSFSNTTAVVFDTSSSIVNGVPSTFQTMDGTTTHSSVSGRKIVIEQTTGQNLVTLKEFGNGGIIFIGMDFFSYDSDMAHLLANTVQFGVPSWLSEVPTSGSTPPGGSEIVQVKVRSAGLDGGTLNANIVIHSNDPARPSVSVGLQLTVIGAPNIVLSDDSLNFGETFINHPDTLVLTISNNGSDTLRVTSISSSNPVFSILTGSVFNIPPHGNHSCPTQFLPTSLGLQTGNLAIASNDSSNPLTFVFLTGTGTYPPQIGVSPDSLGFTVNEGDSASGTLTIRNTGLGSLSFVIENELLTTLSVSRQATVSTTFVGSSGIVKNLQSDLLARRMDPYRMKPDSPVSLQKKDRGLRKAHVSEKFLPALQGGARLFGAASSTISEIDISTGSVINSFPTPVITSDGPTGLAFSGSRLYFTDAFQTSLVYVLKPSDGSIITSYPAPSASIDGLAYVNGKLYAEDYASFVIYELNAENGQLLRTITPPVPIGGGMDGGNGRLFASNFGVQIYELDINTGAVVNSFVPVSSVYGLGFTGSRLFASVPGNGTVEYDPNTGQFLGPISSIGFAALAGGGVEWLYETPLSGAIAPGDSTSITVHARSAGLLGGAYHGLIHVLSNDPIHPTTDASVRLTVIGIPNIAFSADTLTFHDTYVGYADTLVLGVSNIGSDTLRVTGTASSNPRFSMIDSPVFNILPFGSHDVRLQFSPNISGLHDGILTFSSNDPNDPTSNVHLRGLGLYPPVISVVPDSIDFTLTLGDSATTSISISNSGLGTLHWNITNEFTSELAATTNRRSFNEMQLLAKQTLNSSLGTAKRPPTISPYAIEQFGALSGTRRFLAWIPYTDRNPGGEYENTINAIMQFFTDFTLDTSMTTDPAAFASQLSGKDVLIIPEQEGIFDLSAVGAAFSSTVSSFLGAGKTMVVMDFLTTGSTTFLNGTGLMDITSLSSFSNTTAIVFDTSSSIVNGVPSTFQTMDGTSTHSSVSGRKIVFEQTTGQNLVTLKEFGNGGIIFIGMDFFSYNSDMARLLANAVQYGNPSWLSQFPTSGTIAPGGNQSVAAKAKTAGLGCGSTYGALVDIHSDDPVNPHKTIPVRLRVLGTSHIGLSNDTLVFPETYIGYPDTLAFTISNSGCDSLHVTGMTPGSVQFTIVGASSFYVPRNGTRDVKVRFSPTSAGHVSTTLNVSSNDPGNPVRTLILNGDAAFAPSISVSPDSIVRTLHQGDTTTVWLRIGNSGAGQLRYKMHEGFNASLREEMVGDTTVTAPPSSLRMYGNIYSASSATVLREFKAYLGISSATELRFDVYVSSTVAGPYARIQETIIPNSGTGTRFYSSGPLDVPLLNGQFYFIAVAFQGSVIHYRQVVALPVPVSFGQIPNSGFVGGYPPAASVTPLRSAITLWTQTITTGFNLVTSIVPDTAAVNPGDSVAVRIGLKAPAAAGLYRATLDLTSNDPVRRTLAIPLRLDVLTGIGDGGNGLPKQFALYQNYPTPFNPATVIKYDVPSEAEVKLVVYDILGQEVARLVDDKVQPGHYTAKWNVAEFASGVYFYRLDAQSASGDFVAIKKMIIVK